MFNVNSSLLAVLLLALDVEKPMFTYTADLLIAGILVYYNKHALKVHKVVFRL